MRILLCGFGSIGQRHARILKRVLGDEAELGAFRARKRNLVINDDLSIVEGVDPAVHWGIRTFDRLEAALDWRPRAVFVTNPISMHVETAKRVLEADCHVFVEKPLSHSDDGVDALVEETRQRGRTLMVGYQLRHHPAYTMMRRLIGEGAIGRVCSANLEFGEYLPLMHPYEDYRQTHMARSDQGGGAILCLSHEIDAACFLFGSPTSVLAVGGHLSDLELDGVEDLASMLFRASIDGRTVPIHIQLDFLQRPSWRQCRILGEKGALEFEYGNRRIVLTTAADTVATDFSDWQRNQMFEAEVVEFLECVRGERESEPLRLAALATHRACMAARKSLRSGREESVARG
ncbi:MAG: Gfo/Idh/MocA family oxidoreductase [Proteobacteria bacterium]|nr:Gfo/Idh/MocA family oxidoreductase [Pseudomonadota bacterium]